MVPAKGHRGALGLDPRGGRPPMTTTASPSTGTGCARSSRMLTRLERLTALRDAGALTPEESPRRRGGSSRETR